MTTSTTERRLFATVAVLLALGIHFTQIRDQPGAVLSAVFLTASVAFVTFEYYRSTDTRDLKGTVAAIRMDQVKQMDREPTAPEEGTEREGEWVVEKAESADASQ